MNNKIDLPYLQSWQIDSHVGQQMKLLADFRVCEKVLMAAHEGRLNEYLTAQPQLRWVLSHLPNDALTLLALQKECPREVMDEIEQRKDAS